MGLGSIVRDLLPTIKDLVGGQDGFMDDVTIQYWEGDSDNAGTGSYSAPVPFQALVEKKQMVVKQRDGTEVRASAHITFIEALPPHGVSADRDEPLDENDIITLSDGTTGPILNTEGLMDQQTSAPFMMEVYLG